MQIYSIFYTKYLNIPVKHFAGVKIRAGFRISRTVFINIHVLTMDVPARRVRGRGDKIPRLRTTPDTADAAGTTGSDRFTPARGRLAPVRRMFKKPGDGCGKNNIKRPVVPPFSCRSFQEPSCACGLKGVSPLKVRRPRCTPAPVQGCIRAEE